MFSSLRIWFTGSIERSPPVQIALVGNSLGDRPDNPNWSPAADEVTFTMTVSTKSPGTPSTWACAITRPTPAAPAVNHTFVLMVPLLPSEKVPFCMDVMAVTDPDRLADTLHNEVAPQFVALAVKREIHGPLLGGTEIGVLGVKERQEPIADAVRGPVDTTESELEHAATNNSARHATRESICPPHEEPTIRPVERSFGKRPQSSWDSDWARPRMRHGGAEMRQECDMKRERHGHQAPVSCHRGASWWTELETGRRSLAGPTT